MRANMTGYPDTSLTIDTHHLPDIDVSLEETKRDLNGGYRHV
jgi:hypothetical protein